jgi:hypothetical protein
MTDSKRKAERKQMTKIETYKNELLSAIDSRAAYELAKNAENASMQATIKDLRKSVDHDAIASAMLASNVDAQFINRAERSNNRYNVYAAEKVVNVARYLAKAATLNHYSLAIVKAAIALQASDLLLTHADAVCVCSKDAKHKDAKRAKIVKSAHYDKHVSSNTASTQSSSSINALQTFNVLIEKRDAANVVAYELNKSHALVAALTA